MSFVVFVLPLRAGEKIIIGGLAENTLKKLKGAKFALPSSSIVLAKAIGLGPTAPNKYPCNCGMGNSLGFKLSIVYKGNDFDIETKKSNSQLIKSY